MLVLKVLVKRGFDLMVVCQRQELSFYAEVISVGSIFLMSLCAQVGQNDIRAK